MSTISVDVSSTRIPVLQVGYQNENEVTDVLFDVSAWITEYGSGTAQLRVKRPQNSEEESYSLSLPITDGVATWTVSMLDTANKGNGKVQLSYLVGSAVKESVVYPYKVGKSIVGADSPVDPFDAWIEQSKKWAIGKDLDDEDVPATDETYHNNSKYYMEQTAAQLEAADGIVDEATEQADLAKAYAQQFVGAPRAAASASAMSDTSKIYVYTGTTTSSLTNGHWYYHNGSAWADGGVYNSTALSTDTTLTVSGAAADSKKVGDEIFDLKEDINELDQSVYTIEKPSLPMTIINGYWSDGVFTSSPGTLGRRSDVSGVDVVNIVGYIPQWYDYYVFLDANENVISYLRNTTAPETVDITVEVPDNAKYVETSSNTSLNAETLVISTLNKIDNIAELDAKIPIVDGLNEMQIEGYSKQDWFDVMKDATLHPGKYVEFNGTAINIVSNNGYKYYEIPVTAGEKYRTTGLTFFNVKPALYVDENNFVVEYAPTTQTTEQNIFVTVETTVPLNAVKLIVNTKTNVAASILKYGIKYIKDIRDDLLTVKINTNDDADLTVISHHGAFDIVQTARVLSSDGNNNAVCPLTCSLYEIQTESLKTLVDNEDDLTPIQLSSGYIGGGHGYDRAKKITLANHGKTYADIGSSWRSPSGHTWFIVRIIDENNFIMLSENSTDNSYDTFNETIGTPLTHISGAVHTSNIADFTQAMYLLTPLDLNHQKQILLNGVTNVVDSDEYSCNFVDVVDAYDIINPQSIVSTILANRPSGGYAENPQINVGTDLFMHFSNVYRYLPDGTMLIYSLIDFDVDVWVTYWGLTQYAHRAPLNTFGGTCKRYVPKLLAVPVGGMDYDLRIPYDLANWNMTIEANSEYWENADYPPDRIVELYTNSGGDYVNGYAVGYLPVGMGNPSIRKTNINNAMQLYQTKKCYPHFVDRYGTVGYKWDAYSLFEGVAYRKPLLDVGNTHTDVYAIPYGDKCYIYADYHRTCYDRVEVPSEYIGKPITILEKSNNVTVYGTMAADNIRIKVAATSPMYGYVVLQIG